MVAYSFNRRFVVPICLGLGKSYDIDFIADTTSDRPKRQTIRATGKRRHARDGEVLQLYYAQRSSQHGFKIGDAVCVTPEPIEIQFEKRGRRGDKILLPERRRGGKIDSIEGLDEFAYTDGFLSWDAMLAFWQVNHPQVTDFAGVLIPWRKP